MNEVTTIERESARKSVAEMPTEADMIRVLQNSLYPGAKADSVALVLSYCRMNGLDPMLKPVHIVPRKIKTGHDKWEWREVLMPSIADYRIKAARSGEYGGKSEPEFGNVVEEKVGNAKVRYPEWCKITVSRIVQGQSRDFTAMEYWLENYANDGKSETPNSMWQKRAFGQLAKCTESQALRMAFPEFSGGQPTAEEMEGKDNFQGPTIDHEPDISRPSGKPQGGLRDFVDSDEFPKQKSPKASTIYPASELQFSTPEDTWIGRAERKIVNAGETPKQIEAVGFVMSRAGDIETIDAIKALPIVQKLAATPDNLTRIRAFDANARKRLSPAEKSLEAQQTPASGGFVATVDDPDTGEALTAPFMDEVEWAESFLGYWEALPPQEAREFMRYHAKTILVARRKPDAEKLLARIKTLEGKA